MAVNQSFSRRAERSADDRLFLREEELAHGVDLLLSVSRSLSRLLRPAAQAAGLNETQCDVLFAIHSRPGSDVSQLRAHLGQPLPTLARTLGQLDERGLIDRSRKGTSDARRKSLRLTPEGDALIQQLSDALRRAVRNAYRETGPTDVAGTRRVLSALDTYANAAGEAGEE